MGSNDSIKIDVNSNKDMAQLEYKTLCTIRCFKNEMYRARKKKKKMNMCNFLVNLKKDMSW